MNLINSILGDDMKKKKNITIEIPVRLLEKLGWIPLPQLLIVLFGDELRIRPLKTN